MTGAIQPGATLGVLGSGQLGRMFALAAKAMGYRVHVFSPGRDTPTGQVADVEVAAPYDDLDAVRDFARRVDVVTFEFENIPAATAEAAAEFAPVRPDGSILHVTQNRLREKTFLRDRGFRTAPFAAIESAEAVARAAEAVGAPAVLKTAGWGYDGKGQVRVASRDEIEPAWRNVGAQAAILEGYVSFRMELSVMVARGVDGTVVTWPPVENRHVNHVLDVSIAPARVEDRVAEDARAIARGVAEAIGLVGVLGVEMFLTEADEILINELAPRPHNSGHLTIEASATSQFQQQVRAACALPLGETTPLKPAAMANLLGDLWIDGTPNWPAALAVPGVSLHLYGKAEPRPGRKMGHLTALANSTDDAASRVERAREALTSRRDPP